MDDCVPQFVVMGGELSRIIREDGEAGPQLVSCCPPDSRGFSGAHGLCGELNHAKWFVPEAEVWFTLCFLDRVRTGLHPAKGWGYAPESEWGGEVVKYDDPADGRRYAWKLTDEYGGPEEAEGFWRQGVWA